MNVIASKLLGPIAANYSVAALALATVPKSPGPQLALAPNRLMGHDVVEVLEAVTC